MSHGANGVELRIEGDAGLAGLLRVYSSPDLPSEYLTVLQGENEQLSTRLDELAGEARRLLQAERPRALEVSPESPEAGKRSSGGGS